MSKIGIGEEAELVCGEGRAECGQLPMGFQFPEAFGGLDHAGRGPAQSHGGVAPALHVPTGPPDAPHHVLDDVGAGKRAAQLRRQAQAGDGEDLVDPFEDAAGDTGGDLFEAACEVAKQFLGRLGVIKFPCLAERLADRGMERFRQPVDDVPGFVHLAALDRRIAAEGSADRLGQCLGAVDDKQARRAGIEAAAHQIVEQRLNHGGILGRAFDHAQRMLGAFAVDADSGHQRQIIGQMKAVDLDDQEIERGQIRRHPVGHTLRRQRHEPARDRRFRYAGAGARRNIPLRQPHGTAKPPGRDVDQHKIQCPFPQPVLGNGSRPGRQGQLRLASLGTNPGAFDHDLATMEADRSPGTAPSMPNRACIAAVARPAKRRCVLLHHCAQGRYPSAQAEPLKARPNRLPGIFDNRVRRRRLVCGIPLHGVAFLSGFDTLSLQAQGRQRRSSYFNIPRDIPQIGQRYIFQGNRTCLSEWQAFQACDPTVGQNGYHNPWTYRHLLEDTESCE